MACRRRFRMRADQASRLSCPHHTSGAWPLEGVLKTQVVGQKSAEGEAMVGVCQFPEPIA